MTKNKRKDYKKMAEATKVKNKGKQYPIHVAVMVVLMFFFRFLPAGGGITEFGMQILGVFLGTIYGWIFLGLGMPSVMCMAALALTEYGNINAVMKAGFGNSTVGLIIVLFLIAAYIEHVGLNTKIVNYMLSRPFLQGRPYLFLAFYFLAIMIVNLASQKWLSILFFAEFIREMCGKTDMKLKSKEASVLMQETIMVGTIASMALPIKDQPIARMALFSASTGQSWSTVRYTIVALPLSLILVMALLLVNRFILRVDYSCLAAGDLVREDESGLTSDQRTAVWFVLGLCAAMIFPDIIGTWIPFIGTLGSTGCSFLVLGIMLMVRRDEKPLVKLKEIAGHVNWDIILLLAAMFPLVAALSDERAGITEIITGSLGGVTGLSAFLFLFVIVVFSGVLTQFMNNAIAASLFVTALCLMADVLPAGISLEAVTMLIAFSTDMSCWLPSANAGNAYGYGQTDVVEFKYYFQAGFVNMLVSLLILGTIGVGMAMLVY